MYRILTSASIADFVEDVNFIESTPVIGDNRDTVLIVQNKQMQQWLLRELCIRRGFTVVPDMVLSDEGVRFLERKFLSELTRELYTDDLKFLAYQTLRMILHALKTDDRQELALIARRVGAAFSGEFVARLRNALRGLVSYFGQLDASSGTDDGTRIWELSDYISGVFHSYAANPLFFDTPKREHLFEIWRRIDVLEERADLFFFGNKSHHELWQRVLFRVMFPPDCPYDLSGNALRTNSSRIPSSLRGHAERLQIVILGSCFISPAAQDFLFALERQGLVDVAHFFFLPVPERPSRRSVATWTELSKSYRDHILSSGNVVLEPIDQQRPAATLDRLTWLKSVVRGQAAASGAFGPLDRSLAVVSCASMLRQIEAVRDRLMLELAQDTSLLPGDITVLAPDIAAFAPWIHQVFGDIRDSSDRKIDLSYTITGLGAASTSDWVAGLARTIAVLEGRLHRKDVVGLLEIACVTNALGMSPDEMDALLGWIERSEISWGFDANHKAIENMSEVEENTWLAALERQLADALRNPDGRFDHQMKYVVGKFYRWLYRLNDASRILKTATMRVEDWVDFFIPFLETTLSARDRDEREGAEHVLSRIRNLKTFRQNLSADEDQLRIISGAFDGFSFIRMVREQLKNLEIRFGSQDFSGVVFSGIRQFRAVPRKIICLIGMDDSAFPRSDDYVSFNLIENFRDENVLVVGNDVTDRYSWVESIFSAQRALWVFYQGINPETGDQTPPSPLVRQMKELFGTSLETEVEPILPWNTGSKAALVQSSREAARRRAATSASALGSRSETRMSMSVQKITPEVGFSDAVSYLASPLRTWARKSVGLKLFNRDEDDDDVEPLDFPRFEAARNLLDCVLATISGDSAHFKPSISILHPNQYSTERVRAFGEAIASVPGVLEDAFHKAGIAGVPWKAWLRGDPIQVGPGISIAFPVEGMFWAINPAGDRQWLKVLTTWSKGAQHRAEMMLTSSLIGQLFGPGCPISFLLVDCSSPENLSVEIETVPADPDKAVFEAIELARKQAVPAYPKVLGEMRRDDSELGWAERWAEWWDSYDMQAKSETTHHFASESAESPADCPWFRHLFHSIPEWKPEWERSFTEVWEPLFEKQERRSRR